ncbi:MAG: riboflavin synthase [Pseudomonadota bacterium]
MFTGLVTDVGRVSGLEPMGEGRRLLIDSAYDAQTIPIGASISCAGVCLTVTTLEARGAGARFTVDVSDETMDKTTIGRWDVGTPVNLERSLKLGDELGGHMVSGHVDGTAEILERHDVDGTASFRFGPPRHLLPLLAQKGSVALDGTSLTVNEATETFTVTLIPHTLAVTTWGARRPGDVVNIEADTIARYVARVAAMQALEF